MGSLEYLDSPSLAVCVSLLDLLSGFYYCVLMIGSLVGVLLYSYPVLSLEYFRGSYTGTTLGVLSISLLEDFLGPVPEFFIGTPGGQLIYFPLGRFLVSGTDTYLVPPKELSLL